MTTRPMNDLADEAYVYGFPLVFNLTQIQRVGRKGLGTLKGVPMNSFSHASELATPDAPFVSVNNDTVYSIAMLDLSGGPLLLHVPNAAGAYYVLQFVDAWTNNFAYVGRRATGTAEAEYIVTPPGWDGPMPDGATRISAPTTVVAIIGRWACDGPDDLPRVAALQAELSLKPLVDDAAAGVRQPSGEVGADLEFWESMRVWMREYPPAAPDQEYQQRFAPLGLLDAESPYRETEPELLGALNAGRVAGSARIEELSKGAVPSETGWLGGLHLFDYNVDHFEVGTIDSPQWRIADRPTAYAQRAVSGRVGLWGNHAYEAVYQQVFVDDRGEQLSGSRRYELTFTELPPVDGFWSVTMYSMPEYYLVPNPIERYSIGDRTPGIVYNDDGSLTLHIQRAQPDGDAAANWLPAPEGDFRPLMRLYQPGPKILDGSYTLPAIRRTI